MVRDAELDEEPGRGRKLLRAEEMANDREPSCGYLERRTAAAEKGGSWWSVQATSGRESHSRYMLVRGVP